MPVKCVENRMDNSEFDVHPLSGMNEIGTVLLRDGKIYRGIRADYAAVYRDLFDRGIIKGLIDRKLIVDTWITDLTTDRYPLILQHEVIPTISYPSEWSRSQLKAAALLILDLEIALRSEGLTLYDVQPWNVLFIGSGPRFVDFTSIASIDDKRVWHCRDQFYEYFVNSLLLHKNGLSRVARRLMYDPWKGISDTEQQRMGYQTNYAPLAKKAREAAKRVAKTFVRKSWRPVAKMAADKLSIAIGSNALSEITALRDRIMAWPLSDQKTQWAGYYDENFPSFTPSDRWSAKHHALYQILDEAKPKSVLDIGSNRGWYAQLAARKGARVIAADYDESAVDELFADVKNSGLAILPVYMDVRFPEPAQGPAYTMLPPASERFHSDMVMALAIIHHLVFGYYMNFERILDSLSIFCGKWLVVEFVNPDDDVVQQYGPSRYPWYSLDTFVAVLDRKYEVLRQFPSDWGGMSNGGREGRFDRTILFCRKREATA